MCQMIRIKLEHYDNKSRTVRRLNARTLGELRFYALVFRSEHSNPIVQTAGS